MTDDTADLDRILGRLSEEGRQRRDPEAHPSPERLSAYLSNELTPEEDDAIQEHITACNLCSELLLDLQAFLNPPPEERPAEGVADYETAAEWRALREKMNRQRNAAAVVSLRSFHSFFASARGGYSVAAALLAISVGLFVWNLALVRKSEEPIPIRMVKTLVTRESFRSGSVPVESESPLLLPAQLTLNLPTENPDRLYRVDFLPKGSRQSRWSFEAAPRGTELSFVLPEGSLPPGVYIIRVSTLRPGEPAPEVWTYEQAIALPDQ